MKNKADFKKMIKEAGILFAITLIAGILLGFVNELTKEPIARQEELKVQKACAEVFADAASFEEVLDIELPTALGSGPEISVAEEYAAANGVEIGTVYRALSADGTLLGYVINTTSKEGYGGNIELMMGITMDGTLNGISILSISETAGLGMRAGEVLVPQFAGKNVDTFVYTKTGATTDNEIDAISGATITTKAVTNAVNAGLYYFQTLLQEGGNE
ncbi:MAG: RnfABCDGE type electron transport complex subunit G [Lachnospiraceae bacterium]